MVFFNRNLVTFVGSLVFMIHLTWKLSTVTLVGIPVLTMISHIFGNNQKVCTVHKIIYTDMTDLPCKALKHNVGSTPEVAHKNLLNIYQGFI